ncbi:MAG: hypothetical protein JW870_09250 [Candidatus Delongbacteria bacterium]|nr:hypothetical protein [Candidatus Delongbacteria bacterium]
MEKSLSQPDDKKKSKTVSMFLPFETDYKTLKNWRITGLVFLYFASVLSILIPLNETFLHSVAFRNILEFSNYIFIIFYFIINVVTETFIFPATSRARRLDFIDNSLGSKFLGDVSINNFSNDVVQIGTYKMAVNCFENCFFTYNISKGMMPQVITKNTIFTFIFLSTAYVGFKDNAFALPILRVFLSSLFITELIHHLNFVSKLKNLTERFKLIFMEKEKLSQNVLPHSILLILEYETILAYNKAPLSDRVYKKLSKQLTAKWEELKKYYEIV